MINYFDNAANDIIDQDDLYDTNETNETNEFKEYSRDNEDIKHYDILKDNTLKLNSIV